MRFRAPLLYEQYIGQYLTQEELSARTRLTAPKPSPRHAHLPTLDLLPVLPGAGAAARLLQQQEEEEACLEEEDDEED